MKLTDVSGILLSGELSTCEETSPETKHTGLNRFPRLNVKNTQQLSSRNINYFLSLYTYIDLSH